MSKPEWIVIVAGQELQGPMSLEQLEALRRDDEFPPGTICSRNGFVPVYVTDEEGMSGLKEGRCLDRLPIYSRIPEPHVGGFFDNPYHFSVAACDSLKPLLAKDARKRARERNSNGFFAKLLRVLRNDKGNTGS